MAVRRFYCLLFTVFLSLTSANARQSRVPFVIGIDADFSAVAAEGGTAIKRGVELAVATEFTDTGSIKVIIHIESNPIENLYLTAVSKIQPPTQ